MRVAAIVLGVSLATSALAQTQQADDDEKPGSRGTWQTERTAPAEQLPQATQSTGDQWKTEVKAPADTLPDSAPPAATGSSAATTSSSSSSHTDIVGSAPVRLKSRHGGGAAPDEVHTEGTYAGVSLDGDGMPPKAPKLPLGKGLQRLTWPGFQVKDGVPTVFLQTTATPNYTVSETPGALLVTLHGTTIKLRNNERPLKVQDFGTDVSEITAKPHGKDVVVTIKRTGAGHRERVEAGKGGYQLLLVELSQTPRSGE